MFVVKQVAIVQTTINSCEIYFSLTNASVEFPDGYHALQYLQALQLWSGLNECRFSFIQMTNGLQLSTGISYNIVLPIDQSSLVTVRNILNVYWAHLY